MFIFTTIKKYEYTYWL